MPVYYVYEWYIIETGEVFYVGKGKNKRAGQLKNNKFFMDMYNTHNCNYRIVLDNLYEKEAFSYEKKIIKYYKKNYPNYRLTNQTDGGEGASGWKPSKEFRENASNFHKNKWKDSEYRSKMLKIRRDVNGVYKSKEFRDKISEKVKGNKNPNYNNKWSYKQKKNLSEKMKGRYDGENNPNYKNRWSNTQKEHLSEIRKNPKYNNENHGMAKKVLCLETGEIFECIKYAREKYKTITVLGNKNPFMLGYHFIKVEKDIPNEEKLFDILIQFYKENNKSYNIYSCLESKEIIIGNNNFMKAMGMSMKKIKKEMNKNGYIESNNMKYVEIKK